MWRSMPPTIQRWLVPATERVTVRGARFTVFRISPHALEEEEVRSILRVHLIEEDWQTGMWLVSRSWPVAVVWRAAMAVKWAVRRAGRRLRMYRGIEGYVPLWCWPWTTEEELAKHYRLLGERHRRMVDKLVALYNRRKGVN